MITKVLLVDPSIGFAVGIKRALEQPGGYRVTTFANGQAALDLIRAEPQDVAILDFEPDDMDIASLIAGLRQLQPNLPVILAPRTDPQLARVPTLGVQNHINKPYLVRQLIPLIRETLAARFRYTAAALVSAQNEPDAAPVIELPIMHGSEDFTAALSELSEPGSERPTPPDNNFYRHLAAMQSGQPLTTAGLRKTLENFAMPPTAEDSTLAEAIGVSTISPPPPAEPESATPDAAVAAVEQAEWPETAAPEPYYPVADLPESPAAEPLAEADSESEPPEADEYGTANKSSFVAALTAVPDPVADEALPDDDSDDDSAAEIAARLTHLALESTAYATILTRAGALVASAGDLSPRAVAGVTEAITHIWQATDDGDAGSDSTTPPRIRYIQVPGVGDFALYSIRTIADLYLSVLFPADTSLGLIRQQARGLIAALEAASADSTSDSAAETIDESEAARTLLSRPTELLVPNGLRESIAVSGLAAAHEPSGEFAAESAEPPALTTIPTVPYSPYTLLWRPQADALDIEIAAQLPQWIQTTASARAWKVSESVVSAGCVMVRIDLPADQTPGGAIEALQRATAERADQADLWAESYYVIASERAVTPAEIALFVDYPRAATVG